MKALTLGARLLALVSMLLLIQSCDLEDLTGKDDDKDTDSDDLITGSLPSKFQGSWYNESGTYLYEIGSFESEHFIATGNIDYWYEGYTLSNDIYTVETTSDGGADKTFYLKESESSDGIEVSQVSATSGFSVVTETLPITVSAPVANFSASSQTIEEGSTVTYTNNSSDGETYFWTFEGGSPNSSTSENPTVTYSTAGKYDVTLKVTNSVGSDTETKTDHITVQAKKAIRGFAWCGQPTDASYTPWNLYSYNSAGGSITTTRSSTGTYRVTFGNMATTGMQVQVNPYSDGNVAGIAQVKGWGTSGTSYYVDVNTYNSSGTLTDMQFNIYVTKGSFQGAYMYMDVPGSSSTANATYSYNSSGGAMTISSPTIGTYNVTIPGAGSTLGNIQVCPVGTSSINAKVESWAISGSDLLVKVRTYNASGTLTDSKFNMLYTKNLTGDKGAFFYADLETSSGYTPLKLVNTSAGAVTITRSGTGTYAVTIANQVHNGNNIMVTSHGANSNLAVVSGWVDSGANLVANVKCFNASGALADTEFTMLMLYGE